jgi:hypothetical protein
MHREREVVDESAEGRAGLIVLAVLALLVGGRPGLSAQPSDFRSSNRLQTVIDYILLHEWPRDDPPRTSPRGARPAPQASKTPAAWFIVRDSGSPALA